MSAQASLFDVPYPTGRPVCVVGSAVLSDCGTYRYRLVRNQGGGPAINWIMLNPSVADAVHDDPTIRRVVGFSRRWGYASVIVTNLFAFRATDPRKLEWAVDPVGPENDRHLLEIARTAQKVVCAWGVHGALRGRAAHVERLLRAVGVELWALKVLKDGSPGHPLYVRGDAELVRFEPCEEGGRDGGTG